MKDVNKLTRLEKIPWDIVSELIIGIVIVYLICYTVTKDLQYSFAVTGIVSPMILLAALCE